MEENLIPLSQVLKPQFKDFNNFREYVEFLDKKYKGRDGMVKVRLTVVYSFAIRRNMPLFLIKITLDYTSQRMDSSHDQLLKKAVELDRSQPYRAKCFRKRWNILMPSHSQKIS
jgi:hypothetical protein